MFDCLKPDSPSSPQQMFSGLVGVPSGSVSSAQFQAAGLVLGSPPEVFIQMTAASREEGGPHRTDGGPFLPRPPPHHHHQQLHHLHHFHHQPLQNRTSSLLQQATAAGGSERHGPREEAQEDPSAPAPALSELKAVVTWLQRGFPFILILLAKVCFQHKLGTPACVAIALLVLASRSHEERVGDRVALLSCRYCRVRRHGLHIRLRQFHSEAPSVLKGEGDIKAVPKEVLNYNSIYQNV